MMRARMLWMPSPREEKMDAALAFSSTRAAKMVANGVSIAMVLTVVKTGKGKFAVTASEGGCHGVERYV
jgi:hypothetical protein